VGEFAIAIGAPFDLDYSVTFGHVSAKGRSAIIPDPTADQDFIQTDANINPGNSGGPLVNIDGEVMGINTLIRGLRTGIGFAIPSNLCREVSDQLIAEGKFTRARLGIKIETLSANKEFRDLIKGVKEGVVVNELNPPDGPAAKAGIKPADVIVAIDGKPVKTSAELKAEIRGKPIGRPVTLDIVRNGKELKLKVKPEEWRTDTTQVANQDRGPGKDDAKDFGLTVKSLTQELADEFGVEMTKGIIVLEVEPGSVAQQKGIKAGDIITEIDQQPVGTPKQFRQALKVADTKKGVIINLISRGLSSFKVLKESRD
jgi:serine protease Do